MARLGRRHLCGLELPKKQPRGRLGPGHRLMGAAFPPLPPVICKQQAPELEPASTLPPLPQPPLAPAAPIPPAQGAPSMDELIQQSQWNLQQQEQHLLALRQVRGLRLCPLPPAPAGPEKAWGLPCFPSWSRGGYPELNLGLSVCICTWELRAVLGRIHQHMSALRTGLPLHGVGLARPLTWDTGSSCSVKSPHKLFDTRTLFVVGQMPISGAAR